MFSFELASETICLRGEGREICFPYRILETTLAETNWDEISTLTIIELPRMFSSDIVKSVMIRYIYNSIDYRSRK